MRKSLNIRRIYGSGYGKSLHPQVACSKIWGLSPRLPVVVLSGFALTGLVWADQSDALVQQGEQLASTRRCSQAIPYFTRAIQINPRNATAYNYRGKCYGEAAQWDLGIQDIGQAIRLEPYDAKHYYYRMTLKRDKGDLAGALADADKSIDTDPMNAAGHAGRGSVFLLLGKIQDAKYEFET